MIRRDALPLFMLTTPLFGLACDDAQIVMDRPDSGAVVADAGTAGPLLLEPGMVFTYEGRLTARAMSLGEDRSAIYRLTVTIEAVDDRGAAAESTLTYSATGENVLNQDWTDPYDFSSWVARLGPALRTDQVASTSVEVGLSEIPQLPSRGQTKSLPSGNFFLDMRKVDDIRARFAEVYADDQPRIVAPEQNQGKWLFALDESPAGTITYGVDRRAVRIEYDPRGFVTRIDETLGEVGTEPSGANTLTLTSGP